VGQGVLKNKQELIVVYRRWQRQVETVTLSSALAPLPEETAFKGKGKLRGLVD